MVLMTVSGFDCPIDDLPLSTASAREDGDSASREVESHVHVRFLGAPLSCSNGHRWRLDDTVMTRVN